MKFKKEKHKEKIYHGKIKTLTVENQVYDIEVKGDKILIKKTVGGQKIDYREASTERTTSGNTGNEIGRLENIVDMVDYDYINGRKKVNLVIIESYYEGVWLKFRKKTYSFWERFTSVLSNRRR